jgi:hypothetical protein
MESQTYLLLWNQGAPRVGHDVLERVFSDDFAWIAAAEEIERRQGMAVPLVFSL